MYITIFKTDIEIIPSVCHNLTLFLKEKHNLKSISLIYNQNYIKARTDIPINMKNFELNTEEGKIHFERISEETFEESSIKSKENLNFSIKMSYILTPMVEKGSKPISGYPIVKHKDFVASRDKSKQEILDNFIVYLEKALGVKNIKDIKVFELDNVILRNDPPLFTQGSFHLNFSADINSFDKFSKAYLEGIGRHRSYGFGLINIKDLP